MTPCSIDYWLLLYICITLFWSSDGPRASSSSLLSLMAHVIRHRYFVNYIQQNGFSVRMSPNPSYSMRKGWQRQLYFICSTLFEFDPCIKQAQPYMYFLTIMQLPLDSSFYMHYSSRSCDGSRRLSSSLLSLMAHVIKFVC